MTTLQPACLDAIRQQILVSNIYAATQQILPLLPSMLPMTLPPLKTQLKLLTEQGRLPERITVGADQFQQNTNSTQCLRHILRDASAICAR